MPAVVGDYSRAVRVISGVDVPDGKLPKGAGYLISAALDRGLIVRSTYAFAFLPDVVRAMAVAPDTAEQIGEGRDGGAKRTKLIVTLESVCVWFIAPSARAWGVWHNSNEDGRAWSYAEGQTRLDGCFPVRVGHDELRTWIKEVPT